MAHSYSFLPALQAAKRRITHPPEDFSSGEGKQTDYEHYVGSWACTMLKEAFKSPEWIITPERRDKHSKKKPDLIVEKVENGKIRLHLLMELKSNHKGIRFEDAVEQVTNEIEQTMEDQIECFVVVQCGTRIAFFEYHNDRSNLYEEDIPDFRGCVSLTQNYKIKGKNSVIMPSKPDDLMPLLHKAERLRKETSTRTEARDYEEKCVFDLEKHEDEINFLFHHMVVNQPRSSV